MPEYEREIRFTPKISKRKLSDIIKASITDFEKLGDVDKVGNVFVDNGSDVLFVAHRDYVPQDVFCAFGDYYIVFSPQLDDRLGIYVALDLLPQYGIKPDLLLTKDEEIGRSTAQWFTPSKSYNWIFQFDRRGDDVVTYQYNDPDWLKALVGSGFKVGRGTFSDISVMDHMGVCAVNVGTAYYDEHSITCHAYISMLLDQVDVFATFWNKNKDTRFAHTLSKPKLIPRSDVYDSQYSRWQDDMPLWDKYGDGAEYYDELDCEYCQKVYKDILNIRLILKQGCCAKCREELENYDDHKSLSPAGSDMYCEICDAYMPNGDYRDGVCEACYTDIVR